MRVAAKYLAMLIVVLLVPTSALAQASLTGVVRDSSGGVLPGVDLTSNAALFDLIESERDAVIRERCSSKQNGAAKPTSSS